MSYELANIRGKVLGQFASNQGMSDLVKASTGDHILSGFFEVGFVEGKPGVAIVENALRKLKGSKDVQSCATELAGLMHGQKAVFITNGTFNSGVHVSESLRNPKHADKLAPIREKAAAVLARLFRAQKRAFLKLNGEHLRHIADNNPNVREAETSKDILGYVLPDGTTLPMSVTAGMAADYGKALSAALTAGYDGLALENTSDATLGPDAVEAFLREASLTKLTGKIDPTSVDRLRTALADVYEAGGGYDEMVEAVEEVFDNFSPVRTGMIAQTEMNAAYNAGRKQLGVDLGFNEKSWNPDGVACAEICIPNVLQGWIGMDEEFDSGDDAPPGHPNCDCSLDIRMATK